MPEEMDNDIGNSNGSAESLSQLSLRGGRAFAIEVDKQVAERTKEMSEEIERMKKELGFKDSAVHTQSQSLDKIKNLLHCSICMEYMIEPYGLTCGHVACYTCLYAWFTRETDDNGQHPRSAKECPSCRARIRTKPIELFVVKDLVQLTASAHGETLETPPQRGPDIWKNVFRPGGDFERIVDHEDGVTRCGRCTGELVGGVCTQCGEVYSDANSHGWTDSDASGSIESDENEPNEYESEHEHDDDTGDGPLLLTDRHGNPFDAHSDMDHFEADWRQDFRSRRNRDSYHTTDSEEDASSESAPPRTQSIGSQDPDYPPDYDLEAIEWSRAQDRHSGHSDSDCSSSEGSSVASGPVPGSIPGPYGRSRWGQRALSASASNSDDESLDEDSEQSDDHDDEGYDAASPDQSGEGNSSMFDNWLPQRGEGSRSNRHNVVILSEEEEE